ncbi:MAG: pantoate--beta-alanine ligase [Methylococcaceae bacterium]
MIIVKTVSELQNTIKSWRLAGKSIALAPTMGNLHAGHLQLVNAAQKKADYVIVSIFVNPTQFGIGEDFENYPRTELEDQKKLSSINTDLLFQPTIEEIYGSNSQTIVSVTGISDLHCGQFRPGHFNGVTTIVCKLLNIVQPNIAVFGLKDFQQFTLIQMMVRDLNMPVEIIGEETVREANGLAMSSRNAYLTLDEKYTAAKLYQSLCFARDSITAGNRSYTAIEQQAIEFLASAGFQPEYFVVCRSADLNKAEAEDKELVLLTAARLGKARLIDNVHFSI